ncbi:hypothetical protein NE237_022073 [Protea cynaroides]|uniref:FAD-binding domain-containing protein n=1 Tax=Protea cynaroides TaxID=273540 RepID=A0A9Q0GKH3_9MAGN|nr:hypothetical protein NE237_022073 [Protea cynaroides]
MGFAEYIYGPVDSYLKGLATALALKRVGIGSLVLEKSPKLRTTGTAIGVFPNAWLALQAHLLMGYLTNIANGTTQQVSCTEINGTSNGSVIVHKKVLLDTLAGELDPGTIRFSSKLTSIRTIAIDDEVSSSIPISSLDDGRIIKVNVLIGCDGVHSVVARWSGLTAPINSGRSAIRGFAVFPEGHRYKQVAYQFIEEGQRAGFTALNDNELYWFYKSTIGPKLLQKDIMENLAKDYPPYLEVVQHADLETLMWAPLKFRYPWDLIFGHVFKGNITVAGDAPNDTGSRPRWWSALEDAVVLGRHLAKSSLPNPNGHGRIVANGAAKAIEGYVKERRWRAQGGSGFFMKFLRDTIFYGFLFHRVFNVQYDCGKLPTVSSLSESDAQAKID